DAVALEHFAEIGDQPEPVGGDDGDAFHELFPLRAMSAMQASTVSRVTPGMVMMCDSPFAVASCHLFRNASVTAGNTTVNAFGLRHAAMPRLLSSVSVYAASATASSARRRSPSSPNCFI